MPPGQTQKDQTCDSRFAAVPTNRSRFACKHLLLQVTVLFHGAANSGLGFPGIFEHAARSFLLR